MKTKSIFLAALMGCVSLTGYSAERLVGGDISELPTMENANAKYYDKNGSVINDLITYSYEQGMNAMRVRLFVDPETFLAAHPSEDPYACQSYEYILPVCQRIKAAGHKLLLDFHYSDTWADPAKQYTPAKWASLSDDDLYTTIYEYTKQVLTDLKAAGAEPDYIQTGNEISYGMCWGAYGSSSSGWKKAYTSQSATGTNATNLARFNNLLQNAVKACREVSPEAKIVLHSERTPQPSVLTSLYDWANNNGLDYDIIGLSYYPYWHGNLSVLEAALKAIENKKYGKDIWIVETGAAINWAIGDSDKQFYEATDAGQNQFATELLETLDNHKSVTGLFWWEMDYNAKGTSLENWYNGSLFDNQTGKVTSAFYTLAGWNKEIDDDDDDDDDPVLPTAFYLLYNNGGEWDVPGTLFNHDGNGVHTLTKIEIYKDGDDYGWFAITSANSTDWTEINANRFGPTTHNEDPSALDSSNVAQNENSWQVPAGTYDITFDANNNLVKVAQSETTGIGGVVDVEGASGQPIYFNLSGIRVKEPQNGIFIKVENGQSSKVLVK